MFAEDPAHVTSERPRAVPQLDLPLPLMVAILSLPPLVFSAYVAWHDRRRSGD